MKMRKLLVPVSMIAATAALWLAPYRAAADSIIAGNHTVQQAANQIVSLEISVDPNESLSIHGLDLAVQIGDGGILDNLTNAPAITDITFGQTIFDGDNIGAAAPAIPPPTLIYAGGTNALNGMPIHIDTSGNGAPVEFAFVNLVIDATNATIGKTYALNLDNVGSVLSTDLTDDQSNILPLPIVDGTITIAGPLPTAAPLPDVAAAGLALLSLILLPALRRRLPGC